MNADRYRRWFEYEKESHQKVLASLNAVGCEHHTSAAHAIVWTLVVSMWTDRDDFEINGRRALIRVISWIGVAPSSGFASKVIGPVSFGFAA